MSNENLSKIAYEFIANQSPKNAWYLYHEMRRLNLLDTSPDNILVNDIFSLSDTLRHHYRDNITINMLKYTDLGYINFGSNKDPILRVSLHKKLLEDSLSTGAYFAIGLERINEDKIQYWIAFRSTMPSRINGYENLIERMDRIFDKLPEKENISDRKTVNIENIINMGNHPVIVEINNVRSNTVYDHDDPSLNVRRDSLVGDLLGNRLPTQLTEVEEIAQNPSDIPREIQESVTIEPQTNGRNLSQREMIALSLAKLKGSENDKTDKT